MRTIIDTHAHLYDMSDALAVLADCAAAGVSDVVALGVDLASNQKHLEMFEWPVASGQGPGTDHRPLITDHFVNVHLAFGLHPGNITTPEHTEACFSFMREHVSSAIAIGEIGLDFHYKSVSGNEDKKREQQDAFARQLEFAKKFDLPVVIHSRGAEREALRMTVASGVIKANFHWYSGPIDVLGEILDAGFIVSVSPSLEYSLESQAVAKHVPLHKLLIETDTPVRGWVPKDVWRTLRLLAQIKGMAQDDVLAVVNANAKQFFGI